MDLDEWEFIPGDGFLNFREEEGEKSVYFANPNSNSKSVFNMNYFDETPPNSKKREESSRAVTSAHPHLVPLTIPIQLIEQQSPSSSDLDQSDQDSVSQVFFKKETEFVDMKLDSPKSPSNNPTAMGFVAQIEASSAFSFQDRAEEALTSVDNKNDRFNIWKLSLNGIGAICSFGIAAATICLLFFGSHHSNKQPLHNRHFRFQIYDDDKKRVKQHSTKLNEAISAVRGLPQPLTRAHITFGGYYDAL